MNRLGEGVRNRFGSPMPIHTHEVVLDHVKHEAQQRVQFFVENIVRSQLGERTSVAIADIHNE